MPIKKKKSLRNKIIFWTLILGLLALMIMYFPPVQNVTEVVLYPR